MTGFALEWLRLRESFDAAARNEGLAADFAAAVRARAGRGRPVRVVDLGAGSGANFRFLAPLIGAAQDWTLVDDDEHLLAALADELATWRRRTGAGAGWRAAPKCLDLAAALDGLDLSRADGVATSALLDLVSVGWIESLAAALAREGLPFLAALSVDGRIDWDPAHPADGLIAAAFARDQHRDKGFGPALGPDAPDAAAAALEAHGYEVRLAHRGERGRHASGDGRRHRRRGGGGRARRDRGVARPTTGRHRRIAAPPSRRPPRPRREAALSAASIKGCCVLAI
jgi:hypothetical protein